jgi:phage shock protein C
VNARRLYRCRHDRMLAGVAGGMAEYLEVDPTVVRVLWILSAFLGGFTILLYLILVFIMPLEPLTTGPVPGSWMPAAGGPGASAGDPTAAPPAEGEPSATTTSLQAPSGWDAGQAGPPGWTPGGWAVHRHDAGSGDQGSGRAGLVIGIALIVFGALALAGALIPAWAAVGLGPALLLALGIGLVVVSMRRQAPER